MKDTHSPLAPDVPPSIQEFVSFSFFNLSRVILFTLFKKNSPQENSFRRILRSELVNSTCKGRVYV